MGQNVSSNTPTDETLFVRVTADVNFPGGVRAVTTRIYDDNDDYEDVVVIYGMGMATHAELNLFLMQEGRMPIDGTHCTHAHDCCGRFYADPAHMSKHQGKWIVTQRWSRNV